MGNIVSGKLTRCFCDAGEISRHHNIAVVLSNPLDEGIGHSFCYIRPDQFGLLSSSKLQDSNNGNCYNINTNNSNNCSGPANQTTTFRTISGASLSANTATPLSTSLCDSHPSSGSVDRASSFESSPSFASVPLQPIPRNLINSGPLPRNSGSILGSGPIERGFLSGPIERGFTSGPIDRSSNLNSGPLESMNRDGQMQRTLSQERIRIKSKYKFNKWGSIKGLKDAIVNVFSRFPKGPGSNKESDSGNLEKNNESVGKSSACLSGHLSLNDDNDGEDNNSYAEAQNIQWAQGKAGEDRVHVVISEDYGWVFVGIYDGFNGPDAPDFLLSNLYSAIHRELKAVLGNNDKHESNIHSNETTLSKDLISTEEADSLRRMNGKTSSSSHSCEAGNDVCENGDFVMKTRHVGNSSRRWKCEWVGQLLESNGKVNNKISSIGSLNIKHSDVLKALSEALRKTEEIYFDIADKMVMQNPELSLMGSCVLVMLMMGEDIYLMNVGDSRAVIGQGTEPELWSEKGLKEIKEDMKSFDNYLYDDLLNVTSLQLTVDHNTYVKEETQRIKNQHPDDPSAVVNERVKGSLKVTRAFGAGFLKKPKWNEGLLKMFRVDYVGSSPYITCSPDLHHYQLGPSDRFLILSSDGLYQYFTNEEAVSEVEMFVATTPEGDPAQHLVEEVLFRAAKKAGMAFHELLDIPQGERRRYHDDVSIIIISLEGRIWRSSV
ncbi:hypothetical protein Ancab_032053 [Ancistrocladus abbreviatus]